MVQVVMDDSIVVCSCGNVEQFVIVAHAQRDFDRSATHCAIFDIPLRSGRNIDNGFEALATIGTIDNDSFSHGI
jgi:hypothetical protein